jgi:hypothetical protein
VVEADDSPVPPNGTPAHVDGSQQDVTPAAQQGSTFGPPPQKKACTATQQASSTGPPQQTTAHETPSQATSSTPFFSTVKKGLKKGLDKLLFRPLQTKNHLQTKNRLQSDVVLSGKKNKPKPMAKSLLQWTMTEQLLLLVARPNHPLHLLIHKTEPFVYRMVQLKTLESTV